MGSTPFSLRSLRLDKSGLAMTKGGSNSLGSEIGNNCLTHGDAPIIAGHLPVGKNLETAALQ
jgi:hypothetical protein